MPASYEESLFVSSDLAGHLVRLEAAKRAEFREVVRLTIDGQETTIEKARPLTDAQGTIIRDADGQPIPRATTVYDAAVKLTKEGKFRRNPIPILCHQDHLRPVAVCRVCAVEVTVPKKNRQTGKIEPRTERKYLPACQLRVADHMAIRTADSVESGQANAPNRVRRVVAVLAELLATDSLSPEEPATPGLSSSGVAHVNELRRLANRFELPTLRFPPREISRGLDNSSALIQVKHDSCILCDRCIRGCNEVRHNLVIGRHGKGYTASIGFDLNQPMGASSCVACGECMISCPTDALTFKRPVQPEQWKDALPPEPRPQPADPRPDGSRPDGSRSIRIVSARELMRMPHFAGIPPRFLQFNEGAIVRRHVQPGDTLYREGEYGSTAFIIESGEYEMSIRTQPTGSRSQPRRGFGGLLQRIRTVWTPTPQPEPFHAVPITPDDWIVGEMACLNNYPHSATVVAKTSGSVLELMRNVLYMLQRNPQSRERLEKIYRHRALQRQLRTNALFRSILETAPEQGGGPEAFERCVAYLQDRIELLRVEPGQVIYRQGDRAEAMYLIRLGHVRVSKRFVDRDVVLTYHRANDAIGASALLAGLVNDPKMVEGSPSMQRLKNTLPRAYRAGTHTTTTTALDHVELVRIGADLFRKMIQQFAPVRYRLVEETIALVQQERAEANQPNVGSLAWGDFVEQGLFQGQSLLLLDLTKCTRCDECTKACADVHDDGATRLIREGLRFEQFLVATSCRSCVDPYCMIGCPVDAIHRRPDTKQIEIADHCIGCTLCSKNCPYGNIQMVQLGRGKSARVKAVTCDLCIDVVGPHGTPSCVYACPHDAAHRMTGPQLMQLVQAQKQR